MLGKWLQWQCKDSIEAIKCSVILPDGSCIKPPEPGYPFVTFSSWKTIIKKPFQPSLALGEAYANGTMTIENGELCDVLKAMMDVQDSMNTSMLHQLASLARRAFLFRKDGRKKAQSAHIAGKLCLTGQQSVLDTGCGWGGLGLTLARDYGAAVTGITLSREQLTIAAVQAKAEPALPVQFASRDFGDENQPYDRIVSVGMFEHVGKKQFPEYFQKLDRLLTHDGVAVIHTIGSTMASPGSDAFISTYIFPGGYIPKLSEIMTSIEQKQLNITDIEVLHNHYAQTLRLWRKRFMARREEALAMFDEQFCRLREFDLTGCELAFSHGKLVIYQILMAKFKGIVPVKCDYLYQGRR